MSEKEYKDKCESMFKKNAILINENERLKQQIEEMKRDVCKQYNTIKGYALVNSWEEKYGK